MFFADMVMPFMLPYMLWLWFFPITFLALMLEMLVFKLAYKNLRLFSVVASTLGANAASWFIGIFLSVLLLPRDLARVPNGHGSFYFVHGPNYERDIYLGVIVAFLLSIVLEWGVWRIILRNQPRRSLGLMTALANVLSYALLVTCLCYI